MPRSDETEVMVNKDAALPLQPMVFYALNSNHLPTLIATAHRSFFETPLIRPDFKGTGWATFHASHEE
jgi:hypothetical protein